jgi:hypothetical protein
LQNLEISDKAPNDATSTVVSSADVHNAASSSSDAVSRNIPSATIHHHDANPVQPSMSSSQYQSFQSLI